MTEIEMPDGTILEFPDGMSDVEMRQAVQAYVGRTQLTGETLPSGRSAAPGTTPEMAQDVPPDMVYNPETGGYAITSSPEFTRGGVGLGQAYLHGGAQGATLGSGDELGAALNAAVPGAGTPRQRYDYARAKGNALVRENREQHPGATMTGEVAGSFALPGGPARSVTGAAATGGGLAGLMEFMQGEGGGRERLQGVPEAVMAGGATAGIFDSLMRGGRRVVRGASRKRPTVSDLKATKNAAYKAVDDAGEVFSPGEVAALVDDIQARLDAQDYVGGFGQKLDSQIARLEKLKERGTPITLEKLDDIRGRLWRAYSKADDEVEFLDAIDAIDSLIDSRGESSKLMSAARTANKKYKKAEMLNAAFTKAEDQTASTGSGGNINNKYRQAITSIIDNPKRAKWFSDAEIEIMRKFVRGDNVENTLRTIGKLSPGGNGLMTALNVYAATVDPQMLFITGAATAAKNRADRRATRGADAIRDMIAGQAALPPKAMLPTQMGVLGGMMSDDDERDKVKSYLSSF